MRPMYTQKIRQIRDALTAADASGALLSTPDNVFYASGFSSVMDGWHLIEPIAAVFVPTNAALPGLLSLLAPAIPCITRGLPPSNC